MKRKSRKLKKETFVQSILVLMFSQVMIKVLGLVYKLYLTNKEGFGDTGNAIYNSGYQIYALLLALSSIGVPNAIAKLVAERLAKHDEKGVKRIFRISFVFFAIIGLAGSLILFLGAHYIANVMLQIPEAELTLVALSPSVFFVAIASVIRGYFNGYQRMATTANSQTLEQVAKTLITILIVEIVAVTTQNNVVMMAAGANLATTLSVFLSFAYLFKYYRSKKNGLEIESSEQPEGETEDNEELGNKEETENFVKKSKWQILKEIIKISVPMSISSLISAINKNIDSVTAVRGLKTFLPDAVAKFQFGIYTGKVDTLVGLPLSFNLAFATVLVPSISKLLAQNYKKDAEKIVRFSMLATMLIGLPCTFGMIIFAEQILGLLFPNASEGALLLQITSLTIIFMMLAQTVNGVLQGIGKYKTPAIALGCGVLVKLILNIILIPIPSIGINGVAISSIVCHVISFGIGFYVLQKTMKIKFPIGNFLVKPIIATAIMCVTSFGLYILLAQLISWKIALIIALIFAVMIYALAVFGLKILRKDEIYRLPKGEMIYKVLKKMKLYA